MDNDPDHLEHGSVQFIGESPSGATLIDPY
jgi:hypothetical protein